MHINRARLALAFRSMLLASDRVLTGAAIMMLAVVLNTTLAGAQAATTATRPTDTTAAGATIDTLSKWDDLGARATKTDSASAMAMIDSALRVNKRNASAWHRFGVLAWSRARSARGDWTIHSQEAIKLLIAADSALHFAVAFAPDSAMFWRDLARYSLNSGNVFVRMRAQNYLTKGLRAAEKAGDSAMVADLADERGMISWRLYGDGANQSLSVEAAPVYSKQQAKHGVTSIRDQKVAKPVGFPGFTDYTFAVQFFDRAFNANPANPYARMHKFMSLAALRQWPELLDLASRRVAVAPTEFDSWLAIGLASHRMDRGKEAAAAFDTALIYMTPAARGEYTRLTRLLSPRSYEFERRVRDSVTFTKLSEAEQKKSERLYWAVIDPVVGTGYNEFRNEFYARVAYSDLMWTSTDLDYRGANTDRGDIHVRYGPPDREVGPLWRYNSGLTFAFGGMPTFGTKYFSDRSAADDVKSTVAARWDNVPVARLIDTMTTRAAAFRNGKDSLDLVVAVDVPVDKMLKGTELSGAMPFEVSTRIFDADAHTHSVQSSVEKIDAEVAPQRVSKSWVQHIGAGVNVIRVDAYQADTRHIAKNVFAIDTLRAAGFGLSDILMGTRPVEPTTDPARWSDIAMRPMAGTYRTGEPIGLVWETYDLTPSANSVRYTVNVTVERELGPGLRGFIARVRNGIGNALLGQGDGPGRIAISFPRQQAARKIIVEFLTLDLGEASAGDYKLSIEIIDLVSKETDERTAVIRVVP